MKLKDKIQGAEIENRITLHQCEKNKVGVLEYVDFILAFYMVHEVPDHDKLFYEIKTILKPNGKVLMVEPVFHVSKTAFEGTIRKAKIVGLTELERPKILFSRAIILQKSKP